jgi:hypothetical protein
MKNKFNIGDKVMIRGDLKVGEMYGELTLLDSMAEHCGTISEIAYIRARVNSSCCYILKGVGPSFGLPWLWSEEMLKKVKEETHKNDKKPKFKNGDSVKVTEQFADVKTGYYQVLDVLYINEKSWYTLKGAPMIWVPEEYLEINDPESYTKPQEFDKDDYVYVLDEFGMVSYKSVPSIIYEDRFTEHLFRNACMYNRCFSNVKAIDAYQHWTQPIADMCRFKQEKDAEFVSTEANPGYVVETGFLSPFPRPSTGFMAHKLQGPCKWVPTFSTFDLAIECANWLNDKYNLGAKEEDYE